MEKIFPQFLPQSSIEPRHFRFFLILNYCTVLGFVINLLYIAILASLGLESMAALSAIGAIAWASALLLNRQGAHVLALSIVISEVLLQPCLATTEVGWAGGFHYYILLAPPVLFFSPLKVRSKFIVLAIAAFMLVSLQWFGSVVPPNHILSPQLLALFSISNLTTTFAVLAALTYYHHQMTVRAEAELQRSNNELAKLASTDPLTGLLNRRKMVDEINHEVERSLRTYQPFAVLLADLDDFKQINDRLGHKGGDYVLEQIAEVLSANTRRVDRVARWGGEEFLILLPETDLAGAFRAAEKIRDAVAAQTLAYQGEYLRPTITIGVAKFEAGEPFDSCIVRADHALYHGKQAGKNRVIPAEE